MKRALLISSVLSMIGEFNLENIKLLQSLGYEVHVLTNFNYNNVSEITKAMYLDFFTKNKVVMHHCEINRSPISLKNLSALFRVREVISKYDFDIIHCHSPVGGILGRLAAMKRNTTATIIYTAHGFQFFRGGSRIDWILFYPLERFFSRMTDILITINNEDFLLAKKMHANRVEYIHGVGIDLEGIANKEYSREDIESEFSLKKESFRIVSVGELSKRKNHRVIIEALKMCGNLDIEYLICGVGDEEDNLIKQIENSGLKTKVRLLGYQDDVDKINYISDVFAFPSKREGLGLAGLEAMAIGLPILTSNVQGIPDYSIDGVTGFMYSAEDANGFSEGIKTLYHKRDLAKKIGTENKKRVRPFDIKNVNMEMLKIYSSIEK